LINLYWLQLNEADVPAANDWLSPTEVSRLAEFRIAKRRSDWRLGRWTAKRAIAGWMNLDPDPERLANIEIKATWSGAPEAYLNREPAPVSISLSHRSGLALCTIGPSNVMLGCDIEAIESRDDSFLDYFTAEERKAVASAQTTLRPTLVTLMWSAKESTLKALRTGLRLDTRSVVVTLPDHLQFLKKPCKEEAMAPWRPLQASWSHRRGFRGWWQVRDGLVITVVVDSPSEMPIPLNDLSKARSRQNIFSQSRITDSRGLEHAESECPAPLRLRESA
jgi:4'-phosphopantetheinyl transferase